MARTLTLLAGILLFMVSAQTFAQDSRIIAHRKNVYPSPNDSVRFTYSFGNMGDYNDFIADRLKFDTLYDVDYSGGIFVPGSKVVNSYNQQGLRSQALLLTTNNAYIRTYLYTYDMNENLTEKLAKSWVNNAWENMTKLTQTFDVSGNMLTSETFAWGNGWEPELKSIYTYDMNNNVIARVNLMFNTGTTQYDTSIKYSYHYTNNLLDTAWTTNFVIATFTKIAYAYQGGVISNIYHFNWNGSAWDDAKRTFNFYQGGSTFIGDSTQVWDLNTSTWKDNSSRKYRIDTNGDIVSITYKFPNSQTGILENVSQDTMMYNSYHQATWDLSMGWNSTSGTFMQVPGSVENKYYYQEFDAAAVKNVSAQTSLQAFPSPAQNNINVHAAFETPEAFKLQIYDMQGRLVFQSGEKATKEYNKNIPLQDLPSGNYVLQIKGTKTRAEQKFAILK